MCLFVCVHTCVWLCWRCAHTAGAVEYHRSPLRCSQAQCELSHSSNPSLHCRHGLCECLAIAGTVLCACPGASFERALRMQVCCRCRGRGQVLNHSGHNQHLVPNAFLHSSPRPVHTNHHATLSLRVFRGVWSLGGLVRCVCGSRPQWWVGWLAGNASTRVESLVTR